MPREGGKGGGEGEGRGVLKRAQGSLCFSTSGLYIKPLINPEWRPGSDRLTGQAPVQDRVWFITSELQPALIYFRRREVESRGGVFQGIQGVDTETALLNSVRRCWGGEWPRNGVQNTQQTRGLLGLGSGWLRGICILFAEGVGARHDESDGRCRDDESWKTPPRQVGWGSSRACAVSPHDSSCLFSPQRGTVNPPLLISLNHNSHLNSAKTQGSTSSPPHLPPPLGPSAGLEIK